jgi:hypothetical protein
VTVVCEPCGRRGRYNVERLIAKHGDAKILFLLSTLANCPKAQSKARYEGLTTRWRSRRRLREGGFGRPFCTLFRVACFTIGHICLCRFAICCSAAKRL